MEKPLPALISLNAHEARTAAAVFERLFPADGSGPGATRIGVLAYLDLALSGAYHDKVESYRVGLAALDRAARTHHDACFADCDAGQQDSVLADLERGALPDFRVPPQGEFFDMLRAHLQEGLFADPAYGGNRDKSGWRLLGHTGVWLENTAEENLSEEPVTKGGEILSLADVGYSLGGAPREPAEIPGYDPQRGANAPEGSADVVLVGVGAAGALAARILARAGLRVVGLEAGPWRTGRDFVPDELGSTYYCRGGMGPKFLSEVPRWRIKEDESTREAGFTLGRMMNGVGGSVIHWGGALRRNHPHHFRYLTHVRESFGEDALPEGHTLVDWPIGYGDLEPYYTQVEYEIGVAGDGEANPYVPRSKPYPLPSMRPFRMGEAFRKATEAMGLHPYPTPVAVNSEPYNGYPATGYCAWSGGFGPFNDERWHPALTWVPEALSTGNFDLRTHCRVVRVLTDREGRASGVEYVDAGGEARVQEARTVILCGYTFENVRLLFLSGDDRHPDGLGNNTGQVGKNFMTKMWADVHGYFPDTVFNAHTGPAAQMWGLDDFEAEDFDSASHGFIGGATPNVENQRLPVQISREALPPDVRRWGTEYKEHVLRWQHQAAVRLQPDNLSYRANFLDLDPRYRDRSGLGLPVVRVTYDMQENEHRAAEFMERKSEEILREMGAAKVWRGKRFGGVLSSHDQGGCRMGEDPAGSVVDPDLRVHDTPGLYVYGTSVFPTCHGVNPTLTMFALCYRAAERLARRLSREKSRGQSRKPTDKEIRMKIEGIETAYYRLPLEPMGDAGHGDIDTEELITLTLRAEGLTGNGYTYTIGRGGRAVKALIDHDLAPLLVGEDADDIEGLWDLMWRRLLYVGRGGLASFAIAAIDVALWDLRGEREGLPLYALIGAQPREIPAYGSGVDLPKPLDELLAQVEGFMERGLPGVKVKIGRPDFEEDVRRVAAVRDLVGDDIDLMLDANMVWGAEDALEHGRRLERFDPFWYEDPTIPEDVPAHARMVRELGMPIAVGESLHSPYEFQRYADEGAVEVLQIDPITNGGITASLKALRMADEAGLKTSSHYTDELSAHLLCASNSPVYLEKHAFALDPYLQEPQKVAHGKVRPTETPGTGLRFDESALEPHRAGT